MHTRTRQPSSVISKQIEDKLIDDEIKIKYLSLTYINEKTEITSIKIQKLIKQYYPKIKLRVAFKSPSHLGDNFPFKDKVIDPSKQSLVVYHIKCKDCDNDYIGKSEQILSNRIEQHLTDKNSHVFQHIKTEKHRMDFENIEILDREKIVCVIKAFSNKILFRISLLIDVFLQYVVFLMFS